ncbi:adenylate/guanylate cyclase domain-containing protein [Microvirga lotononidis]|uniref:Family 3 adenylate cyclase n=1 Tax=Microvirga lotononidis TaxID=864069 RepID=I4YVA5_9HYPH|nr:adenylate/guanylate cyclase domain-containing protein [Microvirga lotononidis]EIM27897.1 family 3 adenylate cyclase [Microvirga lotononidis]WQO27976.1 adenylate/guanylate cyclase domain-containing protein [Microvirga lotononidis]
MEAAQAADIAKWVTEAGLSGTSELELLQGFCSRLTEAGLPVSRVNIVIDTLHPIHEGRVFRWRRDDQDGLDPVIEYGRTNVEGQAAENWRRSTYYHLWATGEDFLRRRIGPGHIEDFSVLADLRAEEQTDYLALIHRFEAEGAIGEMDSFYSSWTSDAPSGFSEEEIALLRELASPLMLAMKCASLARIAKTLVETYLGRDAGRLVLSGRIARGVTDRIQAVLWFSDLHGFTHITETADPEQIIPFLNDYSEAIISSIYDAGGDVLKLIGDGALAIFKEEVPGQACRCALKAQRLMQSRIRVLNDERLSCNLPVTSAYLGLHIGEVFYGNIGSQDRLDFTVVGPAVNEVSRIGALCRSVERDVLVSSAFFSAASEDDRECLVSVGRYALRGVARPQELFTLDPAWVEK